MIKSFKNKETRAIYEGKRVATFQAFYQQAQKRLQILESATKLEDLKYLPSNRFEALLGDRKGQYSIRINKQWRICFRWENDEAYDVEIVDYH